MMVAEMRWDGLILQVFVGTVFAGMATYQLATGNILMKDRGAADNRRDRPGAFWLRVVVCAVGAVACYVDAWLMVVRG